MARRLTHEENEALRHLRYDRHLSFSDMMRALDRPYRAAWDAAKAEGHRIEELLEGYLPDS